MKKILITGKGSYIGVSFENWLKQYGTAYVVEAVDMKSETWKKYDFSVYDTIFHVAGLAHSDVGNVTEERIKDYYKVNCDLAVETAKKAKKQGIKQFIYMSSMIVYGESAPINRRKEISLNTMPLPANFYGDSKLKAEVELQKLEDNNFKIVILRPPMIYGMESKGNYPLLAKLARKTPLFPDIKNQRSMLYINNLCEFVRKLTENEETGIFFPQNEEYVTTSEMVEMIAQAHGRKIIITKVLNPFVYLAGIIPGKCSKLVNKAFGSCTYNMEISKYREDYCVTSLKDSIIETERQQ